MQLEKDVGNAKRFSGVLMRAALRREEFCPAPRFCFVVAFKLRMALSPIILP